MNCWNTLKARCHSMARNGECDGVRNSGMMNMPGGMFEMGNQQPSTCAGLTSALVNARLGDGYFWRHPECRNSKIVWTSIHKEWVEWKVANLLPPELRGSIHCRSRKKDDTFPNAKPIFTASSKVHPLITEAHEAMSCQDALELASINDLGIWFLDDGSAFRRKDGTSSIRVSVSIGPELSLNFEEFLNWARGFFGTHPGRVYKNNSRASERNKTWYPTKPVAVQLLATARKIASPSLMYKVPVW